MREQRHFLRHTAAALAIAFASLTIPMTSYVQAQGAPEPTTPKAAAKSHRSMHHTLYNTTRSKHHVKHHGMYNTTRKGGAMRGTNAPANSGEPGASAPQSKGPNTGMPGANQ